MSWLPALLEVATLGWTAPSIRGMQDASIVDCTLSGIEEQARGPANLMPLIMDAVRAYASIGEICASLQRVFGEYSVY